MKILVFDTETTGKAKNWSQAEVDPDAWPFVVQLSARLIEVNTEETYSEKLLYELNEYVIPFRNGMPIEIEPEAEKLHGISEEKAREEGIDIDTLCYLFQGLVSQADYLVAHNINFDRNVIVAECIRLGIKITRKKHCIAFCTMMNNIDIMKLPGKYPGQYKWPNLKETVKHYLDLDMDVNFKAHDSSEDVRATSLVFLEMYKRMLNK